MKLKSDGKKKCSRIFYEKVSTVQITNLNMEYPNKLNLRNQC